MFLADDIALAAFGLVGKISAYAITARLLSFPMDAIYTTPRVDSAVFGCAAGIVFSIFTRSDRSYLARLHIESFLVSY